MSKVDLVKAAKSRSYIEFEDLALQALKEKVQENPIMTQFLDKLDVAQGLVEDVDWKEDLKNLEKQGKVSKKELAALFKRVEKFDNFEDFKKGLEKTISMQILSRFKNAFSNAFNEAGASKEDLAKEYGVSVKEVSDAWSKAAGIAKSEGKGSNFGYVVSIVRGMLK